MSNVDYVRIMDWQQPAALVVVAVAALGLFWGKRRTRSNPFKREGLCGCSGTTAPAGQSLVFHARKGQRPSITVKNR